jgi:hypothetical protein
MLRFDPGKSNSFAMPWGDSLFFFVEKPDKV